MADQANSSPRPAVYDPTSGTPPTPEELIGLVLLLWQTSQEQAAVINGLVHEIGRMREEFQNDDSRLEKTEWSILKAQEVTIKGGKELLAAISAMRAAVDATATKRRERRKKLQEAGVIPRQLEGPKDAQATSNEPPQNGTDVIGQPIQGEPAPEAPPQGNGNPPDDANIQGAGQKQGDDQGNA